MRTFSKKALALVLSLVFVVGCIIPVAAAGKTFSDVKDDQWFYPYVSYMAEKNVIAGDKETGLFRPKDNVKRNEFIKMVNCVFGLTDEADVTFTDVDPGTWYEPYYKAAYKEGYLLRAFGDIVFQTPKKELTREEAVALLMAYMEPDVDVTNQTLDFKDASEINPNYKGFVAQAVYQGIIRGYDDDTFKPKNTISRSEAATILYKAAGTILTANATVAASETKECGNAVINGNGASLNFNVDGDLIITEAVDGDVEIKNSVINGTVYVRGKEDAGVKFVNCKVHEIIVEGNASVMLSDGTSVEIYTVDESNLTVMDDASITTVTVAADAKDSKLLAYGDKNSVVNYMIYANGFNSGVLHTGNAVFGDGVTAIIANKVYGGAGFAADTLRTSWEGGYEYIKYTTVSDGYVDYFYSKTDVSESNFAKLYGEAGPGFKSSKQVSAGSVVYEKTVGASMDYKFLVIGFRTSDGKYKNVKSINREVELYGINGDVTANYSSSGKFSVNFYVGINDNAHKGWQAYYTFTDDKNFGTADVKDLKSFSTLTSGATFTEAQAGGKKYVAVFIYENGIIHTPKVAAIPIFYNGFLAVPTVTIKGGTDKDVFSYALPGYSTTEIKYFYTDDIKENYLQSEQVFNDEYNAIATKYRGTISCYGTGATSLKAANDVNGKMYVVICVKGNKPFYVTRMYAGTGFADNVAPTAYMIGTERALSFTSSIEGATLKYMYVASDTVLTAKEFNEQYKTADAKGEIKNCAKNELKFVNVKKSIGMTSYIAVMLSDGTADYQPVCTKLTDPVTGVKSSSFSADIIAETLKFTATHNFENVAVEYYFEAFYINSKELSSNLQISVDSIKNYTDNALANTAFSQVRDNNYTTVFRINSDGTFNGASGVPTKDEKQIALRLIVKAADGSIYTFKPYIIDIFRFDYGFDAESVKFTNNGGREIVKIDLEQKGTIKSYYTNTKPTTAAEFDKAYESASYKNSKTVTKATSGLQMGDGYYIYTLSEYKYIAFLFEDEDGKRTPQVVERTKKNTTGIETATAKWNDGKNGIGITYNVIDVFGAANVTPLISKSAIVSPTKLTSVKASDFGVFTKLNGNGTDGVIGINYNNAPKDTKYVYIVVGVSLGDDTTPEYKFFPIEIEVKYE